ncbi:hypothetical protein C8Q75DRAFT_804600 [Abortiporus biennis]|nr:hypothetical protein C8Q75DRAFT_804600 [Abortiporus biennis]
MFLSGLTPVGLAFVIIVLLAMVGGIFAVIYHSWLGPYIKRRLRSRRPQTSSPQTDSDPEKGISTPIFLHDSPNINANGIDGSPDLPYEAVTPELDTPEIEQKSGTAVSLVGVAMMGMGTVGSPSLSVLCRKESNGGTELVLPPKIHDKRGRFTSWGSDVREAVWYVY